MGVEELRQALSGHRPLLLDTMVFSYHLSAHPRYAPLSRVVLEAVESGQVMGLATTVTLAEIPSLPAKMSDRAAMLEYELYLTHFPNLRWIPLGSAGPGSRVGAGDDRSAFAGRGPGCGCAAGRRRRHRD